MTFAVTYDLCLIVMLLSIEQVNIFCNYMLFITALAACNLLGLKELVIGNSNSSYGHLKSGQGICLPSNVTVPTSEVCNDEASCRKVTYWECKQGI